MKAIDNLNWLYSSLGYFWGTNIAKILIHEVGNGTQIHSSVRYWEPSRIKVGHDCEIRNGTTLDARSSKSLSILIGDGVRIKDYVNFAAYGGEIRLGNKVLVGRCSTFHGHGGIYVGDETMFGPHVMLSSTDHIAFLDGTSFQSQGFTREPIVIGNNVWVGAQVCILAGVTIESDVVVAAGSVVVDTLKSGWIYGGIPAKQLKSISKEPPIDKTVYSRNWSLLD